MIYTLSGSNSFGLLLRLRDAKTSFIAQYGDFALEQVDGDEASYERMMEAMQSLPFLAEKKLVILRSPSGQKAFTEQIETALADVPNETDIYIVEPKLDKRTAYYKYLKKHTAFEEFAELDEQKLILWAVTYVKGQNGSISRQDAQYLVMRVGASQGRVANELAKLLLHSKDVTREVIDSLTERTPQSKIFDLLDAAFAGKTEQALRLYEEQRAQRVEPQEILAMMGWQLRQLALAKTAGTHDLVREGKVSPYSAGKAKTIASRITLRKLKQLIRDITTLDARSKRASVDLDDALQTYLLQLA